MNYYNLIVLDRSGSMSSIRNQAIAGVNETLGTIRSFARQNPDTLQHVSLLPFCSCNMNYTYDNATIDRVGEFTRDMYIPCCSTPLYDAIGTACSKILALTAGDSQAKVSVTIITDGYENASKEWNHQAIAKLIADLKEKGWLFAYIGADHDVEKVAISININNTMKFEKSEEGTRQMFATERRSRESWMSRVKETPTCDMAAENDCYFEK